jgi:hypothetical protein
MVFLLNLLIGLAAYAVVRYAILPALRVNDPVNIIISIIAGVIFFLANLAAQIIQ